MEKILTWARHTKLKRKQANTRLHSILRPIFKLKISLSNKILVCKTIFRPIWSYGIQIWGPAKPSNIRPFQSFQSFALRLLTGAPGFIINSSLHNDLQMQTTNELAKIHYKKFHNKLSNHFNSQIKNMYSYSMLDNTQRLLKRNWPRDLLH